ncbi:MAG: hypothetical protein COA58_12825 [Bacteroidetes bacterium]|nr:MAG: hypothetical protein COA58_12825 [Bacteroidota bacterium]
MRILNSIVFITFSLFALAQSDSLIQEELLEDGPTDQLLEEEELIEEEPVEEDDQIFEFVETLPVFQEGGNAFSKYIAKNLKYPKAAIKNNVYGKVYIQFTVDTLGQVVNPTIVVKRLFGLDSKQNDFGLGNNALDVITKSPLWTPGIQRNKKVKVKMTVPISFKLL